MVGGVVLITSKWGRVCPAMKRVGIKDAKSREGIKFCMEGCPYSDCILGEFSKIKREERDMEIRKRREGGESMRRLAKEFKVSSRTVYRAIRRQAS